MTWLQIPVAMFHIKDHFLPGPSVGPPPAQASLEIGTAEVALVVAISVAIWNFVHYLLQGGRVRVRMRPAVLTDWGALVSGPVSGWPKDALGKLNRGRYNIELVAVTVENLGRTAVTVSQLGLDFGPTKRWRPWKRHAVSLEPVRFDDSVTTERTIRLEPFDERTVLFDVWPAIDHARKGHPGKKVRLRASVRVAGHRLTRLSPRRHPRWVISEGQGSLIPGCTPTFFEVLYRLAWRHLREDGGPTVHASLVTRMVEPLFDEGKRPTEEELQAVIEKALKNREPYMPPHMLAYDLLQATEGRTPEGPSMEALSKQREEEDERE